MIKIAIADDHQMFIDGIESLFLDNPDIEIKVAANNGVELLEKLNYEPIDILLLDSDMPQLDGLETAKKIKEKYPSIRIIVLTMHNEKNIISSFVQEGVAGYILKNTSEKELIEAINLVHKGETFYSQKVAHVMMKDLGDRSAAKMEISEREIDVLKLIAEEYTTNEIAEKLFISKNTVETHRKNLIFKLGAKNVVGLVKYAIQEGYVKNH